MKTGRTAAYIVYEIYTRRVAIWKASVCAGLWKRALAEVEGVRTCWKFLSCSTCWVYGGVVYEWTRNLLEYVSPRSYNMKYTLLELIGLASIGTVSWFVFREVWKFMYSTFIGHALGRSLSLKNIGQWAGRSKFLYLYLINLWQHECPSLPAFFFSSCDRCHRRNWPSIRWRGIVLFFCA